MRQLLAAITSISLLASSAIEVDMMTFDRTSVGLNFTLPEWFEGTTLSGGEFFWLTNAPLAVTRRSMMDMIAVLDAQMEREIVPNSWLYLKTVGSDTNKPSMNTVPFPTERLRDIDWSSTTNGINTNTVVLGIVPLIPRVADRTLTGTNDSYRIRKFYTDHLHAAANVGNGTLDWWPGLPLFSSTKFGLDPGFSCGACGLDDYMDRVIDHVESGNDFSMSEIDWWYPNKNPGFVTYGSPFSDIEWWITDRLDNIGTPGFSNIVAAAQGKIPTGRSSYYPRWTRRLTTYEWAWLATILAMSDRTYYEELFGFVPEITHLTVDSGYSCKIPVALSLHYLTNTNDEYFAGATLSAGAREDEIESVVTNSSHSRAGTILARSMSYGSASVNGVVSGTINISAARFVRASVMEHLGELHDGTYGFLVSYNDGEVHVFIDGEEGYVIEDIYPEETDPISFLPAELGETTLRGMLTARGLHGQDVIPNIGPDVLVEGDSLGKRGSLPMRKPATTFRASHVAKVHVQHFVTTVDSSSGSNSTTNYEAKCQTSSTMRGAETGVCWAMSYLDCENAKQSVRRRAASYGTPLNRSRGSIADAIGGIKNNIDGHPIPVTIGNVLTLARYIRVGDDGNVTFLDGDLNAIEERDEYHDDIATHVRTIGYHVEYSTSDVDDRHECTKEFSFPYIVDWKWSVLPLK